MIIASDVDECLVQFLGGFCNFYNDLTGDDLGFEDFKTFSFKDTLGIGGREVEKIVQDYFRSKFYDNMKFVDGAREGLLKLAESNYVPLITSRSDACKFKTRSFFERMIPERSFDIYFEGWSKLDRLVELRADAIVEDSVDSWEYAKAGIKVLLLDRVWNRGLEHENIYRCEDWGKIISTAEGFNGT